MHKKGLFAALGVVLATVVASLTLVFTVGPKVSADSYIVLADEEYYDIDDYGVLHGLSQYGYEYVNNYCWYVNHIYLEIPEGVVQIGSCYNNGNGGGESKTVTRSAPKSLEVTCGGYDAVEGGSGDYWNGWNINGNGGYGRISGVTLPESLEIIGDNSIFSGFYNLTSIELPENLQYIGSCAFQDCSYLTSITIPDGVTEIGSYAFSGCYDLTSVKMGNDLEYIDNNAFQYCNNLTSVKWSENLIGIGNNAFACCYKLKAAKLPDTMQYIYNYAFSDCWALSQVKLPNNDQDDCGIASYAFQNCSSLTAIAIPNTIKYMGDDVFDGCNPVDLVINCAYSEDEVIDLVDAGDWSEYWNQYGYNDPNNGWVQEYYNVTYDYDMSLAPQIVDEIEQNQNQNNETATEVVADETPVNNTGVVAAVAGTAGGAAGLGTMGTIFGIVVGRKRKKL